MRLAGRRCYKWRCRHAFMGNLGSSDVMAAGFQSGQIFLFRWRLPMTIDLHAHTCESHLLLLGPDICMSCSTVSKMTFFKCMKNVNCRIWLTAESVMIRGVCCNLQMWVLFHQSVRMDLPFWFSPSRNINQSSSPNLFPCVLLNVELLKFERRHNLVVGVVSFGTWLFYWPWLEDIDINHCRDFPPSDIDFPLIQKRDDGGTSHTEGHSFSTLRHVEYRPKWKLDFMQSHCNMTWSEMSLSSRNVIHVRADCARVLSSHFNPNIPWTFDVDACPDVFPPACLVKNVFGSFARMH